MQKIKYTIPKRAAMDAGKLIRFCGLVVELHMHTNVYACGCSLSVMSQVAMDDTIMS